MLEETAKLNSLLHTALEVQAAWTLLCAARDRRDGMPLRVALERAAASKVLAIDPENSGYAAHAKIVRLKPKADNSAHSLETIFNCLNACFLRIDSNNIIVEANAICLNWEVDT